MKHDKEFYWKILKGNLPAGEVLKLFKPEITQDEMEAILEEGSGYYFIGTAQYIAYLQLVGMREIDHRYIYHLTSNSTHPDPSDLRHGDIGYKGKECWRYANGKWEFCF